VHAELEPYYPQLGRPSIDPVLMIRMLIIGYLFAIRSERRGPVEPPWSRPAKLHQSYRHPRKTKRCLKTKLYSMNLKDYTLLVLQLCHFGAANNRDACRSRRIGPRYISRSPQIASGPTKFTVATPMVPTLTPPMLSG
jgi:hypothetical protein